MFTIGVLLCRGVFVIYKIYLDEIFPLTSRYALVKARLYFGFTSYKLRLGTLQCNLYEARQYNANTSESGQQQTTHLPSTQQ